MLSSFLQTAGRKDINQFAKFLLVGCSNFAVSFAVFYLFYNYLPLSAFFYKVLGPMGETVREAMVKLGAASLDATLANILGYGAGIANSFIWNKFWTFRAKSQTGVQFIRFLLLNLSCLLLSSASLFLFTDYLGWSYLPVWFVTMGFVTVINFMASKYWVFQPAAVAQNV